jgi:LytS/YehU family sensor histidine kinase
MATILLDPPRADTVDVNSTVAFLQQQRIRAELWLTLIFWGSNLLVLTLATALAQNPRLPELTAVRIFTTIVGLFFCFLIHLLLRRPSLSTTRKRLIALAIVAPIAAESYAWASFFAEAAVDPTLTLKLFTWSGAVRTIAFWSWFFLAWAGLYLAVSYSFDVREEQQRTAEIRERAHAAQLRALHSQINPHFLFNSLNSLSALILDGKVQCAEAMVTKLAYFLRLGLAAQPNRKIPLSAEVELQKTYLELEQLRYNDLQIRFDIPEALTDARVPALILQPLIENAVKYGVASSPAPASISVVAWSDDGKIYLEITDSGKEQATAKQTGSGGIGLANVIDRLRLIYGENQVNLSASRVKDGGYRALLEFPLELA